jgi:glucose-1-phosphate cytidylyltransferase
MKVILFCGGMGTRLREHSDTVPKPLVNVGPRPILWHLMRYYAHFGHTEFILCLGFRGSLIREYFLHYQDCMSSDFTWQDGGRSILVHDPGVRDWKITFVDTGLHSNIGQRLLRVRRYVRDEPWFLANYADGLGDIPLDAVVDLARRRDAVAAFASVRSWHSFHAAQADAEGFVTHMGPLRSDHFLINGGFFVLRQDIFDYIEEGEELVEQPFARLLGARKLVTYRHTGFWQSMDTLKDKIAFDRMEARGDCPWAVWEDRS